MNGFEATSKIKEIKPEMPIIIQTAYEVNCALAESIKCGCDDFITKTIDVQTLFSILQKHLQD